MELLSECADGKIRRSVPVLAERLSHVDPETAAGILDALDAIGGRSVSRLYRTILEDDDDPRQRHLLEHIKSGAAVADERMLRALADLACRKEHPYRSLAVEALGSACLKSTGKEVSMRTLSTLRTIVETETDEFVLAAAIRALSKRGSARDYRLIAAQLSHASRLVRLEAMEALFRLHPDSALSDCGHLLRHGTSAEKIRLLELAKDLGGPVIEHLALEALLDEDPEVSEEAAGLLAATGARHVPRHVLIEALEELGESRAAAELRSLLEGKETPATCDATPPEPASSSRGREAPSQADSDTDCGGDPHIELARIEKRLESSPGDLRFLFRKEELAATLGLKHMREETLQRILERSPDNWEAHARLARLLATQARWAEAVPHLRKALGPGFDDLELHLLHARACLESGALEAAGKELEYILSGHPHEAEALLLKAHLELKRGRWGRAFEAAAAGLRCVPEDASAAPSLLAAAAEAALRASRHDELLELDAVGTLLADAADGRRKIDVDTLQRIGEAALRCGRLDEARKAARLTAELHPGAGSAPAALLEARILCAMEDFQKALEVILETEHEHGPTAATHRLAARCLEALGLRERAMNRYEQAIALDPADAESQLLLARHHIEHKRYAAAFERFRAALACSKEDHCWGEAAEGLLECMRRTGEWKSLIRFCDDNEERLLRCAPSLFEYAAEACLELNAPRKAVYYLEKVIEGGEEAAHVHRMLAELHLKTGDIAASLGHARRIVHLFNDDADFCSLVGEAYRRAGLLDEGREWFERALELVPDSRDTRLRLAALEFEAGRYDECLQVLGDGKKGTGEDVRALRLAALCLEKTGRYEKAMSALKELLEVHPSDEAAKRALARCMLESGDYEGVTSLYPDERVLDSDDPRTRLAVAEANLLLGNTAKAMRILDKALEEDAYCVWTRILRAKAALESSGFHEAETEANAAIRLCPVDPVPRVLRARAYLARGCRQAALEDARKAVELDGGAEAMELMAECLLALGRTEQAREVVSRALAVDSARPSLHVCAARVKAACGRHAEALEHYENALSLHDGTPPRELLEEAGKTAAIAGRHDEAKRLWETAIRLHGEDPELLIALLDTAESVSDRTLAMEYLERLRSCGALAGRTMLDATARYAAYMLLEGRHLDAAKLMHEFAHWGARLAQRCADVLLEAGAWELALQMYGKADPDASRAPLLLKKAVCCRKLGRRERALALADKALSLGADPIRALRLVGVLSWEMWRECPPQDSGRRRMYAARAAESLRAVLDEDPADVQARLALCSLLLEEDGTPGAAELLAPLLDGAWPDIPATEHDQLLAAVTSAASALRRKGRIDEAARLVFRACERIKDERLSRIGLELCHAAGRLDEMEKLLDEMEEGGADPADDTRLAELKGEVLAGRGQHERALELVDHAVQSAGGPAGAPLRLLEKGLEYSLALGNLQRIHGWAADILRRNAAHEDALLALALCAERSGAARKALEIYDRIASKGGSLAIAATLRKAAICLDTGRRREALLILETIRPRISPQTRREYLMLLADAREAVADLRGAVKTLEELLETTQDGEKRYRILARLAECHLRLGEPAKAVELLDETGESDDRLPAYLVEKKVMALCASSRWSEALHLIRRYEKDAGDAATPSGGYMRLKLARLECELELGMTAVALKTLQEIEAAGTDEDPLHAAILEKTVRRLCGDGRLVEAEKLVRRRLERAVEEPRLWRLLAAVYMAAGDHEEAERSLKKALQLDPSDTATMEEIARLYETTGRKRKAAQAYRSLAGRNPLETALWCKAGALWLEASEAEEALECYEAALERSRHCTDAMRGKARACLRLGRSEEAAELYDRLLALCSDPSPELLLEAASAYSTARRATEAMDKLESALEAAAPGSRTAAIAKSMLASVRRGGLRLN